MLWALEFGVLLVVAVALRRVLHMGQDASPKVTGPRFRRPANNPLCSPLASEVEAHTTILGVLLNDAIDELNSGNGEVARRVLNVFDSERERLVELAINLQNLSLKYLPTVQYPIEMRTLEPESFRSQLVSEFLKRHGTLEQFVFRSKLRFQLRLRLLRRATALLNESFEEIKHDVGMSSTLLDRTLAQLDLYFHDLDLLTKETLLGFSAELASLPDTTTDEIAAEVSALTSRGAVLSPLAPPVQR
jgi:hypothetical protein